jgi:hypothetical protein
MLQRKIATVFVIALAIVGFPAFKGQAAKDSKLTGPGAAIQPQPDDAAYPRANASPRAPQEAQPQVVEFEEREDPDAEPEVVKVNIAEAQAAVTRSEEAGPPRRIKNPALFAKKMTDISLAYANSVPYVGRNTSRKGTVMLFMSLYHYTDINTRYCAMGVAFAACRAFAELEPDVITMPPNGVTSTLKTVLPDINQHYFFPSPSCQLMMEAAKRRHGLGGWVRKGAEVPKPGWLVLYDWADKQGHRNGRAEHIGILVDAKGLLRPTSISTVEYNTSRKVSGNQSDGGAVAPKTRQTVDVLGYIRTH